MERYGATEIPVPGTSGTLFLGPIPGNEETLDRIAGSGIDAVLTLATAEELIELGVPNIHDILLRHSVSWTHFPIRDFDIPSDADTKAWSSLETILSERLKAGGTILIHCRAGFGRSGMIAARLLMACGSAPDDAIRIVRKSRPGTIETPAQLDWARNAGAND